MLCPDAHSGNRLRSILVAPLTHLYIFSVIEGFEFLNLIPEIMEMITRTGQYSVDPYGIPYSDYPSIYIPAILFIVLYIAIDIYLAEKTTQLDKCCSKESVKRFDFYKRFLPCSLATLCFWALIFLGPVIILLINNVNYYFNGTGYGPGSIMYSVLQFISQPTACVIAAYAADAVSKNQHKICVIVNCSVCALVCLLLALVEFLDNNTLMLFTFVVSAVANFIASYLFIKEIWETKFESPKGTSEVKVRADSIAYPEINEAKQEEIRNLKKSIENWEQALNIEIETYEECKKYIQRTYTDEELKKMVSMGKFPADCIKDYVEKRECLYLMIDGSPEIQENIIRRIAELKKELSGIESSNHADPSSVSRRK